MFANSQGGNELCPEDSFGMMALRKCDHIAQPRDSPQTCPALGLPQQTDTLGGEK